jgi:quinol monooxygenase YgiN
MVSVAGHITVGPHQRESYLAGCVSVVEQARPAAGCLDVAIAADLIDPGRVNLFERCESQAAVEAFRSSGPGNEQLPAMLSVSAEYDIANVPGSRVRPADPLHHYVDGDERGGRQLHRRGSLLVGVVLVGPTGWPRRSHRCGTVRAARSWVVR